MGCLKIYTDEYMRIKEKMFELPKRNTNTELDYDKLADKVVEKLKNNMPNSTTDADKEKNKSFWKIESFSDLVSLLVVIIPLFFTIWNINKNVELLQENYEKLSSKVDSMYAYLYETNGVEDQLGDINKILSSQAKVIDADEDIIYTLAQVSNNLNTTNLMTSSFIADKPVGTDEYGIMNIK